MTKINISRKTLATHLTELCDPLLGRDLQFGNPALNTHHELVKLLNDVVEALNAIISEAISSPERQSAAVPPDVTCGLRGRMQDQPTLPLTSPSATPPSGISGQRSLHLRERQRLTRKTSVRNFYLYNTFWIYLYVPISQHLEANLDHLKVPSR